MSLPSIVPKALPRGRQSSSNKTSAVPTLPIITNSLRFVQALICT